MEPLAEAVNLADLERLAAAQLGKPEFDYICGGAGDEITLAENVAAFRRYQLRPRVLVDVADVSTATTFLGQPVSSLFGIAPVAFQHFAHPDAEVATARAAAAAGIPFCLSTMSSRSIEDVAAAADAAGEGPRWFQLYVHRQRSRSEELVRRADAAGYRAIVVTVDFAASGNRERDRRNGLGYPQTFGNFEVDLGRQGDAPLGVVIGGLNDPSFSWRDLDWLRGVTQLPIVVKGVLTAEDAALAVEHGVAAVVVSNHGGRQLDRTPATIDVLAEIVAAASSSIEVYLDGGIRRGVDVLSALALGARGVFVGRPFIYALALGGEDGVGRAIELLAAELRTDMRLLGVTRPEQVTREHLLSMPRS